MKNWIFVVCLGLTACISDVNFQLEQQEKEDPLEIKDPMTTDNQRILDDARREGRLYQ
jgi:hypothetical protein